MAIFPWTWSRGFDLIKKSRCGCGCARPGGRAGTWNQCSTLKKRLPQWIIRPIRSSLSGFGIGGRESGQCRALDS